MQRCEAFLVHLVNVGSTFDQLVHHHVLPVIAGHVEGRVAVRVGLIDLDIKDETVFLIKTKAVISTLGNYIQLCNTSLNPAALTP